MKNLIVRLASPLLIGAGLALSPHSAHAATQPYDLYSVTATAYGNVTSAPQSDGPLSYSSAGGVVTRPANGSPPTGGHVFLSIVGNTQAHASPVPAGVPLTNLGATGELNGLCGIYLNYVNTAANPLGTGVVRDATHMATAYKDGNSSTSSVDGTLRVTVNAPGEDEWTPSPFAELNIPEFSLSTSGTSPLPGNSTNFSNGLLMTGGPGGSTQSGVAQSQVNGSFTETVSFDLYISTNAQSYVNGSNSNATNQFLSSVSGWAYAIIPD